MGMMSSSRSQTREQATTTTTMISSRSRSPTREQVMERTVTIINNLAYDYTKDVDGIFSIDPLHSVTWEHLGITTAKKKRKKKTTKKTTKKEKEKSSKKKKKMSTKKKKEKRNKMVCETVTEELFSSDTIHAVNNNDIINAVPLSPSLASSLFTKNIEEDKKEKKKKKKNPTNDKKEKRKTKKKKKKKKQSSEKLIEKTNNEDKNTAYNRKDKSKFLSVDQILKPYGKMMNETNSLRNLNSTTSRQQEQQYNSDDSELIEFVNDSSVCRTTPKALFDDFDTHGDDNV